MKTTTNRMAKNSLHHLTLCLAGAGLLTACGGSSQEQSVSAPKLLAGAVIAPQTFNHPGIRVNKAQLDFIKSQVSAGVQPFASASLAARTQAIDGVILGSLTYKALGSPSTIECGSYSSPDHGCSSETQDAAAAYTQALLWTITGNPTYAKNAIAIMNLYSHTLTGGHTNSNGPLQAAWTAEKWPAAAEIIRYTYTGWAAADVTAFQNMLKTQYLPSISGTQGNGQNGNWELSMINGMMGIAVFTEDRALFNQAVALWQKWTPAYVYNFAQDGATPVTFTGAPWDWNNQDIFNANTNGVTQETCRDIQHMDFGLAALFGAAETAYLQGTDLYTPATARLTAALELHSEILKGVTEPKHDRKLKLPAKFSQICDGEIKAVNKDTFEIAYNHYHNRKGISLPMTLNHLVNDVRPYATPIDTHNHLWETLTHAGSPKP